MGSSFRKSAISTSGGDCAPAGARNGTKISTSTEGDFRLTMVLSLLETERSASSAISGGNRNCNGPMWQLNQPCVFPEACSVETGMAAILAPLREIMYA